jgi:hypothetical protein
MITNRFGELYSVLHALEELFASKPSSDMAVGV